jgi:hypothetical protein
VIPKLFSGRPRSLAGLGRWEGTMTDLFDVAIFMSAFALVFYELEQME